MRQVNFAASSDRFDVIELRGGLDLLTPTLKLPPGYVRDAQNWEQSITGGYSRIAGYERFDGRPSPSAALYQVMTVAITGAIAVGNFVFGLTSSSSGIVISLTNNLLVTTGSGNFVVGELLQVSGAIVPFGSISELGGGTTEKGWNATQLSLAANFYRNFIAAVPGSGPIRGLAKLNGVVYAWRENGSGTALNLFRSTSAGWAAVQLNFELSFSDGNAEFFEINAVSQGSATGSILRVILESGSWGSGTAAGRMILTSVGGTFAPGPAFCGTGFVTLTGAQKPIVLLPGGRVQTDIGNFGAGPRLYGCDGVNRGFEFDGTTYVPIASGQTIDIPTHVLTHKGHLFFAFGTNLSHSSISSLTNLHPQYNWTVAGGAAQYYLENEITALLRQPGSQSSGAMSISLDNATKMLYGNSALDFQIVTFEASAGAKPYGAQTLGGQSLVFSNTGVFSIAATQSFGNFTPASLTMNIRPFTQQRRNLVTASLTNREKSQYRVFFSDGYGLYMTVANGKLIGSMPVFMPDKVTCACQGESPDGLETSYVGSTNGFVYQLDAGTSHDGLPIDSYLTLTFANQGNSRALKNYRTASLEVQGDGYAEFQITYEIGYESSDIAQGDEPQQSSLNLSSVYWDSFVWDSFVWDARTLAPNHLEMDGSAENVALRITSRTDLSQQFTINSAVIRYKSRRSLRGNSS